MRNLIFIVDQDTLDEQSTSEIITTLITNDQEVVLDKHLRKGMTVSPLSKKKETESKEESIFDNEYAKMGLAIGAKLLPLPAAVLIEAAPMAYSLYQVMTKKGEEDLSVEDIKQSASTFDKYLKRISLTPEMAFKRNYRFQPGHPQINVAYIKHPLSDYHAEKADLYIPSDSIDNILLQERESEMVKIFVTLGATKIEFRKEKKSQTKQSITAGVSVQSPTASGQIEAKSDDEYAGTGYDKRLITLSGREWKTDTTLDKSKFNWLPFEPSWEAVVFAREIGGCLSAELELKKKTIFSSTNEGKIGIGANLFSGSASAALSIQNEEDETYSVRVEFGHPVSH